MRQFTASVYRVSDLLCVMLRTVFRPELIRCGLPLGGIPVALGAEVIDSLRGLQIRGMRAGTVNHLHQQLGIL